MPPRDHRHGRSWRESSSRRSCRRCSRSFVPPPSVLTPSPLAPFSSLCARLFLVAGPPFGPLSSFPAASTLLVASFHGVPLPCPGALRAKTGFPEPPRELLIDLLGLDLLIAQNQESVEQEIGRLVNDLFALATLGGQRDLSCLLDHLLENHVGATAQQGGHIGIRFGRPLPILNRLVQPLEDTAEGIVCLVPVGLPVGLQASKEAGLLPRVAGGADRLGLDQDGVPVAVHKQVLQDQSMSGGLPFLPEPVPRTAPEVDGLGLQRLLEGVGIHEAEHEHGAVPPILHDSRDQALIIEFEVREVHCLRGPLLLLVTRHLSLVILTAMPCSRR